ncbi:hypothetical protein PCANB_002547 [Pneumocystis canis]|nr:hypothetical protein PCANB_002547 [Pneumocystis canis]
MPNIENNLNNSINTICSEDLSETCEKKDSITPDQLHLKQIYKKLDKRLISCLWIIYFFAFSAKSIIGVALTMNISEGHSLQQVLGISSQQISIGITLFYISYVIFEIPSNLIITYISPRFWMSDTLITIGIVLAFHSYMKNLTGFYILRFLLGAMESGLWPGMAYYLMMYYPPHMIGKRIGWYFTASQISSMIIGFVSAGFQKMDGIGNLEGYKWMFLIYGFVSILVGIISMWLLPQTLTEASVTQEELESSSYIVRIYKKIKKTTEIPFLKSDEKLILLSNISLKEPWTFRDLFLVFIDLKIWLLILMYFGGISVGIGVQNYGGLIIRFIDTQMSGFRISFLYGIIWIINLIGVVTILPISDYYRSRMSVFIFCCIIIIIGMLTLTFSSNKWVQYSGLLITMYGTGPTIPICMAWCAQIFGSEIKINVAASSAMLSGLGNLGSVFTTSVLYEGMSGKNAYKKSNLILCGIIGISIIASLVERIVLRYYSKK